MYFLSSIWAFLVFLCLAIVAVRFFVTSAKREVWYFMSGVLILAYMVTKAVHTFFNAQTLGQSSWGLMLAIIPIFVWLLPAMIKLPWMTHILQSDGSEARSEGESA
jgi:CHASE2 domain-containing sensor protein